MLVLDYSALILVSPAGGSGGHTMARRRRWKLAVPRPEVEARLTAEGGISSLLARLLVNRGLTGLDAVSAFLNARLAEHLRSPMLFRDMGRAAERLVGALARGERVGIYGDYDADGVSGSAIMVRFLRALGADPLLYLPHRLREGYGVSEAGVRWLAEAGARVMITVDCGGGSHREIALARGLGVDTIVCDHHQVSDAPLPAHAVINPAEPDAGFPFAGLCGAGVAFYLALGVRKRLREAGGGPVPDLRRYLDLVALGTIADLVPIVQENRVMVKYGLRELEYSDRAGIVALKTVSGVNRVSTRSVGFGLAPRLNAGGRMGDAALSVDLLTTDDCTRASELAAALDRENRSRRAVETEMFDDAVAMIEGGGGIGERRSIVLASVGWHAGVVGIVASRLVERYYRPVVLIAMDAGGGLGRGSGRSIGGLNLYEVLAACRDSLHGFGGHRMAAGLSIRQERVASFAQQVEAAVAARTGSEDFVPVREVDCELGLRAIDDRCFSDLDRMEPHGPANPQPVFLARGVHVRAHRIVGGSHLKLLVEQDGRQMPAIGFGMADRTIAAGDQIDVLYSPVISEWNGSKTAELRLHDLRPHRA